MYTEQDIIDTLKKAFDCVHLQIENQSHLHSNHFNGNGLSHLRITIVAQEFESLSLVKRQRLVNKAMQTFFDQGLHALSLRCKAPNAWSKH